MRETPKLFMATQNANERVNRRQQRDITTEFRKSLRKVKNEIGNLFQEHGKGGKLPRTEMQKYRRLQKFEKFLNKEIGTLSRKQNHLTRQGIIEVYMESYYRFGHMIEAQALTSLSYGTLSEKKIEAVLFNPLDMIKWSDRNVANNQLMVRQIREELMKGMVQGKSYGDIAKGITKRMNVGVSKAIRVAQTEMHRSAQQGQLESMKHAESKGVLMKKRWVSTLDGSTRDNHQDMDGQEVAVDEDFTTPDGDTAEAPSHFGIPEEDINCRCTMISIVAGIEPSLRRARDEEGKGEIIEMKSYKQWKQDIDKGN